MNLLMVGAGPGLGTALARKFGENGYVIGMIARDEAVLDELAAELGDSGIETATAVADVTDADGLRAAIDALRDELGDPDVVLSNTSMMVEATPTTVSLEIFEATWRVACVSTLITLQQVAPAMVGRGSGVFLVPGTALALRPWPPGAALGAAKAAARNLTMGAAAELKPSGVHAAMITIDGMIKADSPFDPEHIAQVFWDVSQLTDPGDWQPEVVYTG